MRIAFCYFNITIRRVWVKLPASIR
jgi:hypothetical protein